MISIAPFGASRSRGALLWCSIRMGAMGSNNPRHNTISLTATVYYPFHPLHGRELRVTSRPRHPELPVTVVDEAGFSLRIPAWMVAPEAAHYQLAEQATLDAQTLRALAALLMPLLNDGMSGEEGPATNQKVRKLVP